MDILAFIQSGIIEHYCLGFCTPVEILEIEAFADKYPAIKNEIERVHNYFEEQLHAHAIPPSPSVKIAVMQSVYRQQVLSDYKYAPLINENIPVDELENWVKQNNIKLPKVDFEDIVITELPSAEKVINFIVAAKTGHEQEVHEDFIEYLFVIEGSCTMDFDGKAKSYNAGDIITVMPRINHSALVTSKQPMLALVQRQMHV